MHQTSTVLAAPAEPNRLAAILLLLRDRAEHCVCGLMDLLGATQSRKSRHMGVLRHACLVVTLHDAQWVRYRLNPAIPAPTRTLFLAT